MDEMSEKTLTMEEAKTECEIRRLRCLDASTNGYNPAAACAWQDAKALLNRVQMPSEEERAVLWLIREWQWTISRNARGWLKVSWADGDYMVRLINPAEQAKKLGWRGGK